MVLEPSDVISGVGLWLGISGGVGGAALLIILSVTHRRTQRLTWFVIFYTTKLRHFFNSTAV